MAKKVNLFNASKAMSERVGAFMRVKVWGITLKARLEKALKDGEVRLETFESLAKDTGKDYTEVIEDIKQVVENAKAEYKKATEEAEKFEYTKSDLALYKAYKDGQLEKGIIEWFAEYGLEVDGQTNIVMTEIEALKGARKLGGRAVVRANAEKFTDDIRAKGDILTVFYGKLAEAMMDAGTLKPEAIPEDVRAFYAPAKKVKK